MPRPVVIATMTSPVKSGTVHTIDLTSIPDGSWIVAMGYTSIGGPPKILSVNPPAPMTRVILNGQPTGTRTVWLFAMIKEPGVNQVTLTYDLTFSVGYRMVYGSSASAVNDWVVGLAGVRQASNAVGGVSVQAGTSLTSVAPAITLPENALELALFYEATTATEPGISSVSPALAMVYSNVGTATDSIWIGQNAAPPAGPTAVATVTYVNSQVSNGAGIQLGLTAGPEPIIGLPVKRGDGSRAYASFLNGAGQRVTPTSLRIWRPGFQTVAEMLATPGATWAHRGGSASYPEMSEFAYDQSVMRGYPLLEFSAQRSSDGVWFGMHNPNFDESAGVVGSPNASTLTWAQIQATYQNTLRPTPGWPSRPYLRLDAFLAKYGKTHLLMIDPKNAMSFNTEMLNLVDASGVDKARLMWKFYGIGNTASNGAAAALARGWGGTWGYFYDTDIDTSLAGFQADASKPAWTTIGMNYAALQSYWDTALAIGKPVVGHIASTQANYATAISKGARMVQVSGVAVVVPVGKS